jgi:hypothetical protein
MADDQAAIDAIKAKFPPRITSFDGFTYSVHEAIDRAASISRASQGSREGDEGDVERVARAICAAFKNDPDEVTWWHNGGIQEPYGPLWLQFVEHARAAICALPPPATPQAPEDVRERAALVITDAIFEGRLFDEAAKAATMTADALSRAHLLATPVTVTMEECDLLRRAYSEEKLKVSIGGSFQNGLALAMGNALRRVLGDRIQISGQGGEKS